MMDIAQVARQSGLPASTLRYYEEKGLIQSIGRRGLRRLFDRDILDRLSLVALGRNAGFSLEEIAQMFGPRGALHIDRGQLSRKAEEIDHSIHRLMAMRDGLRHAAKCPATHHLECPTFRRIVALTRKRGARGKR